MNAGRSVALSTPGFENLAVALATRDGRLAMTLEQAQAWDGAPGVTRAALTLPALAAPAGARQEAALAIGERALGVKLEPVACAWTFGPSARHVMDRAPALGPSAPFLRYERFDADDTADVKAAPLAQPRRVSVCVYLARAVGSAVGGATAVVWLPLTALRAVVGGLWLVALLALDGVEMTPAAGSAAIWSPADTLVFTPANAGERHLLRACAKYGDAIVFSWP